MENVQYISREVKREADRRRRDRQLKVRFMIVAVVCALAICAVSVGCIIANASYNNGEAKLYRYYTTVTVEENDTLWSLAEEYNNGSENTASYISNIKKINNLNSDTIHADRNIVVYYYSSEVK